MPTPDDTFMNEERSPLIWQEDKLPLFVGAAGHIRHGRGELLYPMRAHYIGIIWCVAGNIAIEATGVTHELSLDSVFLIDHGTRFQVHISSDFGEFLYLSIDGKESAQLLATHDLWEGIFRFGSPPFTIINTIMENLPETEESRVRVTLVEALDLLKLIHSQHNLTAPDKAVFQAEVLIHRHWRNSSFNLNTIRDALQVNRSSLSARFKSQTGRTMLEYLHEVRLNKSIHMLKESAIPISRVAYECGFSDAAYYSRFIKKKTGKPPQAFRPENSPSHS